MVSEILLSFQSSINLNILNQIVNNLNKHPWAPIDNWRKTETYQILSLSEINGDAENIAELEFQKNYLELIKILAQQTILIYHDLFSGDILNHRKRIDRLNLNIGSILKNLDYIRIISIQGKYEESYQLKVFCISQFNNIISILDHSYGINVKISPLKNYFYKVENRLNLMINAEEVKSMLAINRVESERAKNDYSTRHWFTVGLLFASGEMDELMKTFNRNSTAIAKNINLEKWSSIRPYISESISNTTLSNKNIFHQQWKIQLIFKHCEANQINICVSFKERIESTRS